MTDEVQWTKDQQRYALAAIDITREAVAGGITASIAETVKHVKHQDGLMGLVSGLTQVSKMLVEHIEKDFGVSAHDTLLDCSNAVKKVKLRD